jgi:hypothetical protein
MNGMVPVILPLGASHTRVLDTVLRCCVTLLNMNSVFRKAFLVNYSGRSA